MAIKDSGERKEFSTGAVRDISKGKDGLDYVPLDIVADLYESDKKSSATCPDKASAYKTIVTVIPPLNLSYYDFML